MAQSARHLRVVQADEPSLDPAAMERAYARERARRRARYAHQIEARNSRARYWVVLAFLVFLTIIVALTALHQIQRTFGV